MARTYAGGVFGTQSSVRVYGTFEAAMRLFSNEDTLMAFRGQNVAEISFCVHSQSIRLHNLCGLSLRNNAHISCTPSRPFNLHGVQ